MSKKMTFKEFLELQASLMPAVNFAPGSVAFYDLMRSWNTEAILHPDKCADVVVWGIGTTPTTMKNDINLDEYKDTLKTKVLTNLPDEYRTNFDPKLAAETKKKQQEEEGKRKAAAVEKARAARNNAQGQPQQPAQEEAKEDVASEDSPEAPPEPPVVDEDGTVIPTHAQQKNEQKGKAEDKKNKGKFDRQKRQASA